MDVDEIELESDKHKIPRCDTSWSHGPKTGEANSGCEPRKPDGKSHGRNESEEDSSVIDEMLGFLGDVYNEGARTVKKGYRQVRHFGRRGCRGARRWARRNYDRARHWGRERWGN